MGESCIAFGGDDAVAVVVKVQFQFSKLAVGGQHVCIRNHNIVVDVVVTQIQFLQRRIGIA